jgi:hypothetical protein
MIFSPVQELNVGADFSDSAPVVSNTLLVKYDELISNRRIELILFYNSSSGIPRMVSRVVKWAIPGLEEIIDMPLSRLTVGESIRVSMRLIDYRSRAIPSIKVNLRQGDSMIYDSVNTQVITSAGVWDKEATSTKGSGDGSVQVVLPARVGRKGGIIQSSLNKAVYIGFGAAPSEKETSMLSKGSRIDIPANFEGEIFCNFKGQVATPGANPGELSMVEYFKSPSV